VSKYNARINYTIHRKGASFAANWPDDTTGKGFYAYWTGQVEFGGDYGYFGAELVHLVNGDDGGGNFVSVDEPVTVCVP
jgi:hypothetical protein